MTNDEMAKLKTECLKACRNGNLDRVKELLAQGVPVNGDVDGWTGLLSASIHEGQREVAEYLFEKGAEAVHDCDSQMGAVNYGHPTIVRLLLAQGADPNFTFPRTGETMLHIATLRGMFEGNTECVRLLQEAGANPNVHCKVGIPTPALDFGTKVIGETPLHRAAAFGSEEMIQFMVEAGADITATDAHGETPLTWYGRFQRRKPHLKLERGAGKYLEGVPD